MRGYDSNTLKKLKTGYKKATSGSSSKKKKHRKVKLQIWNKCIKQKSTDLHANVDFLHCGYPRLYCARSARERRLWKRGRAYRLEKVALC